MIGGAGPAQPGPARSARVLQGALSSRAAQWWAAKSAGDMAMNFSRGLRQAVVAAMALGGAAFAASSGNDFIQLGVGEWFSSAESEWQITFPGGRSMLEWNNLDGEIPYVTGELRVLPWLSLGGLYGRGDVEGDNSDRDWVGSPDSLLGEVLISRSTADTSGETSLAEGDLYVRLLSGRPDLGAPRALDLVLGYRQYKQELNDRNGVDTDGRRFRGLDSTFDFEWSAAVVGLRGEWPVQKWLRVRCEAAALVAPDYHGEGYWNLRDDYRRESPNFVQDGSGDTGVDLRAGVELRPVQNVAIEVGYSWFNLEADGHESTYFSDNTKSGEAVKGVKSTSQGVFASVGVRF